MRLKVEVQVLSQALEKSDYGTFSTDLLETQQNKLADGSIKETTMIHQVLSKVELKPGTHSVIATFKVNKANRLNMTILSLADAPNKGGGKAA